MAKSELSDCGSAFNMLVYLRRDHRDPRRVFRELWHVADGYSRFAVLTAVDYVSFQYVATRHWLRTRLEKGVRVRPPSQFLY